MFIVFEGIDGCGKTTQQRLLGEWFVKETDRLVHFTAEPSDSELGKLIRHYFSTPPNLSILTASPEILEGENVYNLRNLFFNYLLASDRLLHTFELHKGIASRVASQQIVISSRYLLSNYAYNCDNQIDIDMVLSLNHPHLLCAPDLTIYLRIDPDLALDRIKSRDNIDFLENSYHLYRASGIYDQFFADGFDSYYNSGFAITIDVDLLTPEEIHSKIIDSIVHTFPEFSQFRSDD